MYDSLLQQIQSISRTAKSLLVMRATSIWLCFALLILVVCAAIDYLLRPHGFGFRWLEAVVFYAAALFAFWKWMWPSINARFPNDRTARLIEQSIPSFKTKLSSTVEFLEDSSREENRNLLKERMVQESLHEFSMVDLTQVIDRRSTKFWCGCCILMLTVVATFAFVTPNLSRAGVVRIAFPWLEANWPTKTNLEFLDLPTSISAGDSLDVTVIDRNARLPQKVDLFVARSDEETEFVLPRAMQVVNDVAKLTLPNCTETIGLRATAGDDNKMRWATVRVNRPPELVELTLSVNPPEYTKRDPYLIGDAADIIVGSTLSIRGVAGVPLRRAAIELQRIGTEANVIELSLSNKRRRFHMPDSLPIVENMTLNVLLTDQQEERTGIARRIAISALEDQSPAVEFHLTNANRFTTPQGRIHLSGTATDDVAVESIHLESDKGEVVDLFDASNGTESSRRFDRWLEISEMWNRVDNEIRLRVVAIDSAQQARASEFVTIEVLSRGEFLVRLRDQEQSIKTMLSDAVQRQEEVARETRILAQQQPVSSAVFRQQLQQLMQRQSQVRTRLVEPESEQAVASAIRNMLQNIRDNRILENQTFARLRDVQQRVEELGADTLSEIESILAAQAKTPISSSDRELEFVNELQANAIEQLNELVGVLVGIDESLSGLHELRKFRRKQVALHEKVHQHVLNQPQAFHADFESKRNRWLGEQRVLALAFERIVTRLMVIQTNDAKSFGSKFHTAVNRLANGSVALLLQETNESLLHGRFAIAAGIQQQIIREVDLVILAMSQSTSIPNQGVDHGYRDVFNDLKMIYDGQNQVATETRRLRNGMVDANTEMQKEISVLAKRQRQLQLDFDKAVSKRPTIMPIAAREKINQRMLESMELLHQEQVGRRVQMVQREILDELKNVLKILPAEQMQGVPSGKRPFEFVATTGADGAPSVLERQRVINQRCKRLAAKDAALSDESKELSDMQLQIADELEFAIEKETSQQADASGDASLDSLDDILFDATATKAGPPNVVRSEPSLDRSLHEAVPLMRTSSDRIAAQRFDDPLFALQQQILDLLMSAGGSRSQAGTLASSDPSVSRVDTTGQDPNNISNPDPLEVEPGLPRANDTETLFQEGWGKLPPQVRDAIPIPNKEMFLPGYEERTQEYFRRLLERSN